MKYIEKRVMEISRREDERIDDLFARHVGFVWDQIPEKMRPRVEETRKVAFARFSIHAMCASEEIARRGEEELETASGVLFRSRILAKVMKEASQLVYIASTLKGLEEAMEEFPKATDRLYLDAWATGMLEVATGKFCMDLKREVRDAGVFSTATWSPGQHGFEIQNQKPFFSALGPEEIGIRLKDSYMMTPQKSETQLFGICENPLDDSPVPCDFCDKRSTCPNAYAESVFAGGH